MLGTPLSCCLTLKYCRLTRRDLSTIGDSVLIGVTKDGIKFSTSGDIGSANINVRLAAQQLSLGLRSRLMHSQSRLLLENVTSFCDSDWLLPCRQNTNADKPEETTVIDLQEPVSLSFALRYLNSFAKASPLSNQVQTLHKLCSCSPHDACTVGYIMRCAVHVSR